MSMAPRCITLSAIMVWGGLCAYSQGSQVTIEEAWSELLGDAEPRASAGLLEPTRHPQSKKATREFVDHFFFNTRSEYIRQEATFSGLPTLTGVIDGEPSQVADPGAILFPGAFQPNSDHFYSAVNWGTQGWLSPRVNTNFSLRYRRDLSFVDIGSPSQTILNTFPSDRLLELTTGVVELQGITERGTLANSTVRLGRQNIYGAEMATVDGLSWTLNQSKYSVSFFGGRRFTYYSNPEQRAIGGASLGLKLPGGASFEYQGLYYVKGIHRFVLRQPFQPNWFVGAHFKMIASRAVDFGAQLRYLSVDGLTGARFTFAQKLSNHDFMYDYTFLARERGSFNRLGRLNLGAIAPHRQFSLEAHHQLLPVVRLGGALWVRRLNRELDAGPFDTSFEDYRSHLQFFPSQRLTLLLEFHHRRTHRPSPLGVEQFDDLGNAGETRVQDISAEISRSFGEDRLGITLGIYHREIDLQNRFFFIDKSRALGAIGGVFCRLDRRTRLFFRYGLDEDFHIFRPSLQRFQTYRLGLDWKL